jgi:hypothetical protein
MDLNAIAIGVMLLIIFALLGLLLILIVRKFTKAKEFVSRNRKKLVLASIH